MLEGGKENPPVTLLAIQIITLSYTPESMSLIFQMGV